MTESANHFDIIALGAQGDGIAGDQDTRTFIFGALPGERWTRTDDGFALDGPPSVDRRQPICRHFGACGGCVAQHMGDDLYRNWKRDCLVEAFRLAGVDAEIGPLITVAAGSRRRLVLTAMRLPSGVALGFHRRGSDRLLDIAECAIADPMMVRALPGVRLLASRVLPRSGAVRVSLTRAEHGLDLAFDGVKANIGAIDRGAMAQLAGEHRILRVSLDGEPIINCRRVVLRIGGITLEPAPAAFLQAVPEAEAAMIALVSAAAGKAKRVADLFCGVGTFALPLARKARVLAIDSDAAAVASLDAAARNTQGLKPIETRVRDLMREPLSRKELEGFDAVVFDPPRAGALAQAEAIAKSQVSTVIAASCNPTTMARDLAMLVNGGYEVEEVTPIDQFLYSNHLEAVAVLRRPRRR